MKAKLLLFGILALFPFLVSTAQVGIGNTSPQASLDISATSTTTPANNDGILIPRMSVFPSAPGATRDGMLIFYTGASASGKGFYYWDGAISTWIPIKGAERINDLLDGKSDNDGTNNGSSIFLGIDAGAGDDTSDNENIGIGYQALENNVSGNRNIAIGNAALQNSTASFSTAIGSNALALNTTGVANLAIGPNSLSTDTTGDFNLAIGIDSGLSNTIGRYNSYLGNYSGRRNISGSYNTFVGNISGNSIRGSRNVVVGHAAGGNQTVKNIDDSVFIGYFAGALEFGSDKLYIENSSADSDNALIYGEFDTNILRTNSEFQIGNPTGTGYAFPIVDGSIGQLFTTDGNGQLSFVDPSSIFSNDHDWYEEGSANQPDNINDNIYTQGNVGIGQNTPVSPLHIGISTPFDLDHVNIGQDGLFIVGQGDNSGANAVGGSISFGPPSSTRGDQRKSAISSVQTSGDEDHTGLAFYVHANPVNQSPMVEGMRLTHQRRLGINNTDPSANLDVIGTMQFQDGNEAVGYVLASDAAGNATWTDPNTLIIGVERINDLIDGKSDNDGTNDGSSVFLGISAGATDDSSDNRNVGVGYQSLENNTTGQNNTGVGYLSLNNNIDGSQNTAVGLSALLANTNGSSNTAIGYHALFDNTDGINNTAAGNGALNSNISGGYNTANGAQALFFNSAGSNTATGYRALYSNTSGTRNASFGLQSLNSNSTGSDNVAIGYRSGYASTGSGNIFIGSEAGNGATGDNKFFVENTNADENSALVYGEFDNDILRTNSEFQIGNPTGTGYAFPTSDGIANQILETDGSGQLSWVTPSSSITASNGLTETSGDITLGGLLTQNTTITQSVFDLTFDLSAAAGNFIVGTNGFVVESAGDVGIGVANPAYDLDVEGNENNSYVANFRNISGSANGKGMAIRLQSPGVFSATRYIDFFASGGTTNRGSVQGSGPGVNYATTSDRRLKTNIEDISDALSIINSIKPRIYEYKEFRGRNEYGFIAQELQPIYPQAVSGSPDSDVTKEPMMVDYSRLTPILTAGIKELMEEVNSLKAENATLKAKLEALESLEARLTALEKKSETTQEKIVVSKNN